MLLGNFCATQLPLTVLEWDNNFQQMFSVTRGQKERKCECFSSALSVALTALQHLGPVHKQEFCGYAVHMELTEGSRARPVVSIVFKKECVLAWYNDSHHDEIFPSPQIQ